MRAPAVRRPESCISDLRFDEWAAGEIDADEVAALTAHVQTCDRCRARQESLRREAEAFLAGAPRFVPPSAKRPRARKLVASASIAAAAVAAAAAVLLFIRAERDLPSTGQALATRTKGGPHLGFFVKRGDAVVRGEDGQTVYPGDRLRFVATTSEPRYLAVLGLDRAGVASVYYPAAEPATPVSSGREVPLETAVELDAILGTEEIFALFCSHPIAIETERARLSERGTVQPGAGCHVDRLTLHKKAVP